MTDRPINIGSPIEREARTEEQEKELDRILSDIFKLEVKREIQND